MICRWSLLFSALLLGACTTTGGLSDPRGSYSHELLEDGKIIVSYRGAPGVSPSLVERRAMIRAAEVAVANGYNWFVVLLSEHEADTALYRLPDHFSAAPAAIPAGTQVITSATGGPSQRVHTTKEASRVEIKAFKEKPETDELVYSVAKILESL